MPGHQTVGAWLREQRTRRGFALNDVGARADLARGGLSRIENEHVQVTFAAAVRLVRVLGLTLDDLVRAVQQRDALAALAAPRLPQPGSLTPASIRAIMAHFRVHPDEARDLLARGLATIYGAFAQRAIGLDSDVIHRAVDAYLRDEPTMPIDMRLLYPWSIDPTALRALYQTCAAIVADDPRQVTRILYERARVDGMSEPLRELPQRHIDTSPSLERILLIDVLTLDEVLTPDGLLIGLWQEAVILGDVIGRPDARAEAGQEHSYPRRAARRRGGRAPRRAHDDEWALRLRLTDLIVRLHRWETVLGLTSVFHAFLWSPDDHALPDDDLSVRP